MSHHFAWPEGGKTQANHNLKKLFLLAKEHDSKNW